MIHFSDVREVDEELFATDVLKDNRGVGYIYHEDDIYWYSREFDYVMTGYDYSEFKTLDECKMYVLKLHGVTAHADYPHEAGTLYGCETCEAKCFCGNDDSYECVRCSIESERGYYLSDF